MTALIFNVISWPLRRALPVLRDKVLHRFPTLVSVSSFSLVSLSIFDSPYTLFTFTFRQSRNGKQIFIHLVSPLDLFLWLSTSSSPPSAPSSKATPRLLTLLTSFPFASPLKTFSFYIFSSSSSLSTLSYMFFFLIYHHLLLHLLHQCSSSTFFPSFLSPVIFASAYPLKGSLDPTRVPFIGSRLYLGNDT